MIQLYVSVSSGSQIALGALGLAGFDSSVPFQLPSAGALLFLSEK